MSLYQIFAILAMIFAGLTSVIAKAGLKNVSGDTGLAIRTIFVFILVWINTLAFSHQNEFVKLTKKDILFLGISALTTTLSWIFYYKAIKIGPVSEVALIDKASIVLTLILSFIFLKEQVTLKIAIGSMLIVGGILVLTIK
jgi:bacterial/archaeal transporter family protein